MGNGLIKAISGTAIPLRGNDIDTDRIIPARFLRCVTFDGLGEHVFEDDRQQDPNHAFNQERYAGSAVLFAGRNFGCGSSREHAPQSLSKWGIQAVIGLSFAEIFFGNCISLGIPCLCVDEADLEALQSQAELDPTTPCTVDVATETITYGDLTVKGIIPPPVREAFLSGTWNVTLTLLEAGEAIDATAAKLPYVSDFA
jgi:3-isopropylmalate/(R)-2-methylmalate dehydratase small subunit